MRVAQAVSLLSLADTFFRAHGACPETVELYQAAEAALTAVDQSYLASVAATRARIAGALL